MARGADLPPSPAELETMQVTGIGSLAQVEGYADVVARALEAAFPQRAAFATTDRS